MQLKPHYGLEWALGVVEAFAKDTPRGYKIVCDYFDFSAQRVALLLRVRNSSWENFKKLSKLAERYCEKQRSLGLPVDIPSITDSVVRYGKRTGIIKTTR